MFFVHCFVTLKSMSAVGVHWGGFFMSVKLQSDYMDQKMSPEPESTKWWAVTG